jgi:hypothetical protein
MICDHSQQSPASGPCRNTLACHGRRFLSVTTGVEISEDEALPQATKGDDSVAWIGKVK